MRNGQPALAHKPKDFCTIEQASYIAQQVIRDAPLVPTFGPPDSVLSAVENLKMRMAVVEHDMLLRARPWYKRLLGMKP